jgi:hypothetical protein
MPFNTLGNLGAGLALNYNDQPIPSELLRLLQQQRQQRNLAGVGMTEYGAPNLDRNISDPDDMMLYNWFKSQSLPQERP